MASAQPRSAGAIVFGLAVAAAAAAAGPAPVAAQDPEHIEHRLKPGESPYTLARDYLASPADLKAIITLNRIANARRIPVGTIIRLPRDRMAYHPADLRIAAFSGEVSVGGVPAAPGMAVPEGATIRTGASGFVSLRGSGGAVMTLPTNTEAQLVRARIYRLDDLKDIAFRLVGGRGETQVPALRPRERFRIITPRSVSAVRGTIFRVGYREAGASAVVEVVEGAVATSAAGSEALTGAGFGLAAGAAGLSEPERLLAPPEISAPGAVQTQAAVTFALPLPAASRPVATGIRTQIARDAGFLDIIGETITAPGTAADFGNLADGRYFVRARAISASGIEGNSETFSFRRKRLGTSAAAEPSGLDDGYRFAWLPEGDGPTTYAFQLWNTARPGLLLIDEVAMERQGIIVTDLASGTYEWRVAAVQIEDEGLLQVWGPIQRLTVTQ